MPITPFHFGPGAALHAAAPGQISFLAFGAANVLIDIEPGYYLLTHQFPLHRFCHTLIGATLIMVATLVLFGTASRLARYLPDLWHWKALTRRQIAWGAALGSYSHIVLDSVMHDDIRLAEAHQRLKSEQARIAGAGAGQPYMTGLKNRQSRHRGLERVGHGRNASR